MIYWAAEEVLVCIRSFSKIFYSNIKGDKMKIQKTVFAVLLMFSIYIVAASALTSYFNSDEYVEVNIIKIIDNNIIFGNNCTVLTATTSPERARSIELGLEGKIEVRPTTHDTFAEVLKSYNITVESVLIESKDEEFYYSSMILSNENKVLKLDSMPSDAMAVALRTNTTIYVSKRLLEQDGTNICE